MALAPGWEPAPTFTDAALLKLEREDDVFLLLTELTDEALGLAELRGSRQATVRNRPRERTPGSRWQELRGLRASRDEAGVDVAWAG